ncbi:hypothetical protein RB594_001759 [Gaeumannomyces avenae]
MAADTAPLASLSLTHVYYDPSDPVSYVCAWLALVPQALCVVYATLIWSSREAEVALMFAGQLACEAVNFALKRLIKEERPRRIHGKGYGMPSSHAQFVAFWALSLALFLLVRHRPHNSAAAVSTAKGGKNMGSQGGGNETTATAEDDKITAAAAAAAAAKNPPASATAAAVAWERWQQAQSDLQELYGVDRYPHRPWSVPERLAASAVAFGLAGLVAWSRVYLGYHTTRQVLVGLAAGLASAAAWFALTAAARSCGLLGWAVGLPAARLLRLRDLVVEEDLCQAGWEKWEERRRVRAAEVAAAAGGVKVVDDAAAGAGGDASSAGDGGGGATRKTKKA